MVAGDPVKALQVVGHDHRLIHQTAEAFAVHHGQLLRPGTQGHAEQVIPPALRLPLIQALTQKRQQRVPVVHILLATFDARRRGAGVLPVDVHAGEAVAVHQPEDAVRQPFPALRRGAGVGEALRAPAAHGQHAVNVPVPGQIALQLADALPVAAVSLAALQQGKGVVDLINVGGHVVRQAQIGLIHHVQHHTPVPRGKGQRLLRFHRIALQGGKSRGQRHARHHHRHHPPAQHMLRFFFGARLEERHRAFTSENVFVLMIAYMHAPCPWQVVEAGRTPLVTG